MNLQKANDTFYEALVNLTCQMYPGTDLNDPLNPIGISQEMEETGDPPTPYIRTQDGMVEAWACDNGAGRGLRTRYRYVLLPVFNDDVGDELFFANVTTAAKAFLCLHLQMRLSATSISFRDFPATWPLKISGPAHQAAFNTMTTTTTKP